MIWEANERAEPEYFEHFATSVLNISSQLRTLKSDPSTYLAAVSRSISVELRKLLLEDNNSLVSRCVRKPKLHKLLKPQHLGGDSYTTSFEIGGGSVQVTKIEDTPGEEWKGRWLMAPGKFVATVHPLYGLCYDKRRNIWISEDPYDRRLTGIRIKRWLNQPVLQLNNSRYSMRQILSEVANTQGAHVDTRKDSLRSQIGEHFSSMYLNIFTIITGAYVNEQVINATDGASSLARQIIKHYPQFDANLYKHRIKIEMPEQQLSFHDISLPAIPTTKEPVTSHSAPASLRYDGIVADSFSVNFELKVPELGPKN